MRVLTTAEYGRYLVEKALEKEAAKRRAAAIEQEERGANPMTPVLGFGTTAQGCLPGRGGGGQKVQGWHVAEGL